MSCYFCLLYMSCSECSVLPIKIIWGKSLNCNASNGPQGIQLTEMNQDVHFVELSRCVDLHSMVGTYLAFHQTLVT